MVLKIKINDLQSYSKLIKTFNQGMNYSLTLPNNDHKKWKM